MKLTVKKRDGQKKSELTRIRAEKDIPAVFYAVGRENVLITIDGHEFRGVIRKMEKGHLPTTVFELEIDGKTVSALVRDIQYHRTTYDIIHLDFHELSDDRTVDVLVPVRCINAADSVGVKLGGFLRPVKRHVKVRCKRKDLPTAFDLDVKGMNIGHSLRVKHLSVPENVNVLLEDKDVLVVMAKR